MVIYNYGTLEERIVSGVRRRLGLANGDVRFVSWIRKPTGDVPVVRVPATHEQKARDLGLTLAA